MTPESSLLSLSMRRVLMPVTVVAAALVTTFAAPGAAGAAPAAAPALRSTDQSRCHTANSARPRRPR
jgi:hypothetical protein